MCSIKLVSFFVVQVMIIMASPPPPSLATDLPKEKWNELAQRAEIRLQQLALEQGPQFKLIRIDSVQEEMIAGQRFIIKGQFQPASGKQIECTYELHKEASSEQLACPLNPYEAASVGYEDYRLHCGEKEYRWSGSCGK